MNKKFFIVGIILLQTVTFAQLTIGIESNSQWYIDDNEVKLGDIEGEDRLRTNSYIKADYKIKDFTVGAQLESYESKALLNYSPDLLGTNLGTYSLNYTNQENGLEVTVGHFYEQFGSGLALRTWEDRQIGVLNSLLGGNVKYNFNDYANITALYGKQRVGMGFDLADSSVYGTDLNLDLSKILGLENNELTLGGSFVSRKQTTDNPNLTPTTHMISSRIGYSKGNFAISAEYVLKSKEKYYGLIKTDKEFDGNAALLNISYSKRGIGMSATLRRLENFKFFSERDLANNTYNVGVLHYVPALTKQFDYSLTNIYVYQAQNKLVIDESTASINKAGEIGGQLDFFYTFPKGSKIGGKNGMNVNVNYSLWKRLKTDYNYQKFDYESSFLVADETYYSDASLEIKKKWSSHVRSNIVYVYQKYNRKLVEDAENATFINTHILVADNTFTIGKGKSIRVELQHMFADTYFKNWAAGLIEFYFNNHFSIYAQENYNYGNENNVFFTAPLHYYNAGIVFTQKATRIHACYGRQRGGLHCVGGVCRYVPENTGLSLGIVTNF